MSAAQVPLVDRAEARLFALEPRRDGVAIVTIDDPRDTQNTITENFIPQLTAMLARVEEDPSVSAVVLVSGKADFLFGMDLGRLKAIKLAADAESMASELGLALRKLEGLRKPIVAAVHGAALGTGFEVALACHAVVVSSDPKTVVGLPDTRIGLIPAGNGLLRVAARLGLRAALDLGLSGETLRAGDAWAMGLVDDVCSRTILMDSAIRQAKGLVGRLPRIREPRPGRADWWARALDRNPIARGVLLRKAREGVRARSNEANSAQNHLLSVLERFATKGFDAAAQLEARSFGELVVSATAHRLIELSFATRALETDPGLDEKAEPRQVRQAAVLGAGGVGAVGAAGAFAAYATVRAGIPVRLKERDHKEAGLALRAVRELLDARVASRDLAALEGEQAFARLSGTLHLSGIRNADVIIEALPEDLALKRTVLRDVEALIDPTCVYASSTAGLPIAKIAEMASRPERVLGMHFLSCLGLQPPQSSPPLLEIVRADRTAPWAVATAVAFGKRQRQTVIVVRDGPGFYTTRILVPFLNEAVQLVSEGVAVDAIDAAMVDWGFPLGPLHLVDVLGIDVVAWHAQLLHVAFGDRMTPPSALAALTENARVTKPARGAKGSKDSKEPKNAKETGEGAAGRRFYRTSPGPHGSGVVVDPRVHAVVGAPAKTRLPVEEIQMRCALAMTNEAIRCLGEGVLRGPRDGDVGAVLGLGFPRSRGGPFRYVDAIGAADVLRRVQGYADRFGERWRAAPVLVQQAKRGERFFA